MHRHEKIHLPAELEVIENDVFSGCGLESLDLPAKLKVIGENAFRDCFALKDVYNLTPEIECRTYAFRDSLFACDACPNCGGELKGWLLKKCTVCGRLKDY